MAGHDVDPHAVPVVRVAGGAEIPALGLGTWQLNGRQCVNTVAAALELGYRHFDTAALYENEREVGQGLRLSGVPREDAFLTTKVFNHLGNGPLQAHARQSAERLQVDWVDLMLIHWPSRVTPLEETIEALKDVVDMGLARAIGVSNFPVSLLERSVALSRHPLAVNQVEYHPALDQSRLLAALRRHNMGLTAYSPLGKGRGLEDSVIRAIAQARGRTPAQVVLRWLIQQDSVIAIPRTRNRDRLRENLASIAFELTEDEMALIDALKRPDGRIIDPSFAPAWDS